MAIKKTQRGFALLIAVIFMTVMLSFGVALSSLAYKQQVLTSGALGSQSAFYVADAALECILYADQQQNLFVYPPSDPLVAPNIPCSGGNNAATEIWSPTMWVVSSRFSLDAGKHCADVAIYKPKSGTGATTYVFSQGYNASCSAVTVPDGTRFSSRGLVVKYQ